MSNEETIKQAVALLDSLKIPYGFVLIDRQAEEQGRVYFNLSLNGLQNLQVTQDASNGDIDATFTLETEDSEEYKRKLKDIAHFIGGMNYNLESMCDMLGAVFNSMMNKEEENGNLVKHGIILKEVPEEPTGGIIKPLIN